MVRFNLGVGVPLGAGAVVDLDEAHALFHHASREQAEAAHTFGRLIIEAVELASGFRLAGEVDHTGGLGLHACGQFVARQAGTEFRAVRVAGGEVLINAMD